MRQKQQSVMRREVEWCMPESGGGESGESVFSGCKMKSSGDGWMWWLHNTVNVLDATKLYI